VPDILDNLYEAGRKLLEKAETLFPGISFPKSGRHTGAAPPVTTVPTVKSDVVSDPGLNDNVGSDWTGEGGAAPEGPATNTRPRP
jgi:hypothetical protein